MGDSNYNTIPSTVQIDSTQADFYLVSDYDRSKLVGRPTVTIAIDVVTRTIVGISVGFESPSWKTTMMVLSNVAGDKVAFCNRFGIEIKEEEWPISNMIPNRIVTDRGPEFLNSNMQQVVDNLGVIVEYTPSYRADLKGVVERMMGTVQKDLRGFTDGEVSTDIRKKANKYDYRMNASLTLYEFTQLIIKAILHHNNHHVLSNYQRTEDMIKQEMKPIPLEIWNYSQENMMGYNYIENNFVNLCVMPREKAKVTAKGIEFRNILYGCESGLKEQWFVVARNKGDYPIEVSFDPRDTSKIYTHLEDGSYEIANILNYQEVFKDKTYEEVRLLLKAEKNMVNHLKEEHLAATVDYIADVQEIANVQVEPTKESKASKLKDIKVNKEAEILMNHEQIVEVRPPKEEVNELIEEVVEEKEDSVLDRFMKRRLAKHEVRETLR